MTYSQMQKEVQNLASGLSELGIKRCCFFMETRAEWMVAAQACFQHNIQIVTVYATLGELAVAQALKEAEIEVIITSASLCESKIKVGHFYPFTQIILPNHTTHHVNQANPRKT